jgi:hypothetical protein
MENSLNMFGNIFVQKVFCCKQPNGDYVTGLHWKVQGENWKPYSKSDLPETIDKGKDTRRFKATDWRKAKQYAKELCKKYGLEMST